MSSNRDVLYDEDGDTPDWIEIFNYSNNPINLSEYYLSDDSSELLKWQLPDFELPSNSPFLIFASGKDRRSSPTFWYTLIDKGDEWKYIIPVEEPSASWKTVGFDDELWINGASGIGYGDDDDETKIAGNTLSVFMRKKITINNIESLESLLLHFDFDDAFVAYLNGTEIARYGIGQTGEVVPFNKKADMSNEARIINGESPRKYDVTEFISLLNEGENVLAVQVHNISSGSSDLTAIPFLSVGYLHSVGLDEPVSEYIELPSVSPHTNFKLSSSGETVSLTKLNSEVADSITYGIIPGGHSFGRNKNGYVNWVLFNEPTPGLPNQSSALTGVVSSVVQFSVTEMFLTSSQNLVLTGAESGEEIRYTLDSNEPTSSSPVYNNPIQIDKNINVRARIFKANYVPGKITTRTYLFDAPPTLPVISVTTDPDNLWDNETGIYILGDDYSEEMPHLGANYWEDWEKAGSIEMTETDGSRLFSLNCGIKIFGGWSRANDNKSLSIFFRNEYGDHKLKGVQLFDSKPITKFKSLVLRKSGNDYGNSKMRDGMLTSLVRNLDIDIAAYRPTIMYLNGEYWGIINLREKLNEDFIESNHGVDADEMDILQWNVSVVEGSNEHYLALLDFIENNDLSDDSNYEVVSQQIDISNFIDYQLSEIYFNNRDWPGNNIKYWRPQTDEGKWRWLMYDTDFGFGIWNANDYKKNTLAFATATDGPAWPNPPWSTFLFRKLLENESFKHRFINRYADVLNSTFLPDNVISHIDSLFQTIEPEMQRNYEKWLSPNLNYWYRNIQNMLDFATNRPYYERLYIKQEFSIPEYHKVKISILPTVGGAVDLNSLTITKSGWEGDYFEDVPIILTANSYTGYKFKSWMIDDVEITDKTIEINVEKNTNIRVLFEDGDDDGNSIVINEINYNSTNDDDAGDWVEIYNWGRFDLDISGWIFKDSDDKHRFIIPENTILKSNEYLVFCKSESKFNTVHGSVKNYI
ncbi:MAG: CotH kinase family protein, partial [Draconibacterium sp.]|nr:CotH kinase family protein [Draconibacterium sp.]